MNKRNSILESLSEGMLSVNSSSKSFMDIVKGKIPKGVEVECDNGINFKIPSKYASVLTNKHKPLRRFGKVNVYEIRAYDKDSGALVVEFTDTILPITPCLIINRMADRFDVACSKLQKAFTDGVVKTIILAESLGYLKI